MIAVDCAQEGTALQIGAVGREVEKVGVPEEPRRSGKFLLAGEDAAARQI